jgi:hypothetical protein
MTIVAFVIATGVFISGGVISALAVLAAGIRSDGRARNLTSLPRSRTAAVTRWLLGVDVRGTEDGSESRDEHS